MQKSSRMPHIENLTIDKSLAFKSEINLLKRKNFNKSLNNNNLIN